MKPTEKFWKFYNGLKDWQRIGIIAVSFGAVYWVGKGIMALVK